MDSSPGSASQTRDPFMSPSATSLFIKSPDLDFLQPYNHMDFKMYGNIVLIFV